MAAAVEVRTEALTVLPSQLCAVIGPTCRGETEVQRSCYTCPVAQQTRRPGVAAPSWEAQGCRLGGAEAAHFPARLPGGTLVLLTWP